MGTTDCLLLFIVLIGLLTRKFDVALRLRTAFVSYFFVIVTVIVTVIVPNAMSILTVVSNALKS